MLAVKQRQNVEAQLVNSNILLQILQMVAEQCECVTEAYSIRKELAQKPKLSLLLARLNDRTIILLQHILIDCHDSLSTFRFTVFLSSRYSPSMHKFVIDGKNSGKSNSKYTFDVCIYSRRTGNLIAVGMQNKNTKQKGSDSKSLSKFLRIIADVSSTYPQLQGVIFVFIWLPTSVSSKNKRL